MVRGRPADAILRPRGRPEYHEGVGSQECHHGVEWKSASSPILLETETTVVRSNAKHKLDEPPLDRSNFKSPIRDGLLGEYQAGIAPLAVMPGNMERDE
jgi:hypothetical protein